LGVGAEPLAGTLPADPQCGADLAPTHSVESHVRDGGADLLVMSYDDATRLGPHGGELPKVLERVPNHVGALHAPEYVGGRFVTGAGRLASGNGYRRGGGKVSPRRVVVGRQPEGRARRRSDERPLIDRRGSEARPASSSFAMCLTHARSLSSLHARLQERRNMRRVAGEVDRSQREKSSRPATNRCAERDEDATLCRLTDIVERHQALADPGRSVQQAVGQPAQDDNGCIEATLVAPEASVIAGLLWHSKETLVVT